MPYRFWKIPDHKLMRIGCFATVAVILVAAAYSILSIFCGFYIVDGDDLADGKPWRRYAILPQKFRFLEEHSSPCHIGKKSNICIENE